MIEYILTDKFPSRVEDVPEQFPNTVVYFLLQGIAPEDNILYHAEKFSTYTAEQLINLGEHFGYSIPSSGRSPVRSGNSGARARVARQPAPRDGRGHEQLSGLTNGSRRGAVGPPSAPGGDLATREESKSSDDGGNMGRGSSTRFIEEYIRPGILSKADWSLNIFGLSSGYDRSLPWHQNYQRKILANEKIDISIIDLINPDHVDDRVLVRLPKIVEDALDLAIKLSHASVVSTIALAFIPGNGHFVPSMNKVFAFALQHFQENQQNNIVLAEYFDMLFEPWVLGFGTGLEEMSDEGGVVMWRQFNKYSWKWLKYWLQNLRYCKELLTTYFLPDTFQRKAAIANVEVRTKELNTRIDRLTQKALATEKRAKALHDLLFEPIPSDTSSKIMHERITGSIEVRDYFLRDGDLEQIPYTNRKFTRTKITARPKTPSLQDFANHIITRVSFVEIVYNEEFDKFEERAKIGADGSKMIRDFPSDEQLEQICPKHSATIIPRPLGQSGGPRGCMLTLSLAPQDQIQIFAKPKFLVKGDQVLITNDQVDAVGEMRDLVDFHHRVGTFMSIGELDGVGVMEVEFAHPTDIKGPKLRKLFPRSFVIQAPNTYLHAFCYGNIWAEKRVRYRLEGMTVTWTSLKSLFQDVMWFDEIERALHIEDMYGHTPLEILIRESNDDYTPTLLRYAASISDQLDDKTIFNRMLRTSVGGGRHGLIDFPSPTIFQWMLQLKPVQQTINHLGGPNTVFNHDVEVGRIERRFGANKAEIAKPSGLRGWLGLGQGEVQQQTMFGNLEVPLRDGELLPEKLLNLVDTRFPPTTVLWCACHNDPHAQIAAMKDEVSAEEFPEIEQRLNSDREAKKLEFETKI